MGQPSYRGKQLFRWLYGKKVSSFEEMTDLPTTFRAELSERCVLSSPVLTRMQTSRDGTTKALFTLPSGRLIESVMIPDESAGRFTACVSSQVGCAMGCTFCATGKMGFIHNLLSGEIFDQAYFLDQLTREKYGRGLTNVVFMGMGEPLLNYKNVLKSIGLLSHPHALGLSRRRLTLSTVGLARRIRSLADEDPGMNLAVSLHAPTTDKRNQIVPINRRLSTGLEALIDSLQYYTKTTRRQITFEYCLFRKFNDTEDDALALSRICRKVHSKVNLLMYNAVPGVELSRTSERRLNAFVRILVDQNVTVTVRRSRGEDIDAACGQLATANQTL